MANDYAGFRDATSAFLTKVLTGSAGLTYDQDVLNSLLRQLIAMYKADMAAQGITL